MSNIKATGSANIPSALTVDMQTGDLLLPITPDVAAELRRNPRTIKRWMKDPSKNFPQAARINGRLYIRRRDFEAWKRDLFLSALNSEVAA